MSEVPRLPVVFSWQDWVGLGPTPSLLDTSPAEYREVLCARPA